MIVRSANLIALLIGAGVWTIYLASPFIGRIVDMFRWGMALPGLLRFLFFAQQGRWASSMATAACGPSPYAGGRFTILIRPGRRSPWVFGYLLGASFTVASPVIFSPLPILVRPWERGDNATGGVTGGGGT